MHCWILLAVWEGNGFWRIQWSPPALAYQQLEHHNYLANSVHQQMQESGTTCSKKSMEDHQWFESSIRWGRFLIHLPGDDPPWGRRWWLPWNCWLLWQWRQTCPLQDQTSACKAAMEDICWYTAVWYFYCILLYELFKGCRPCRRPRKKKKGSQCCTYSHACPTCGTVVHSTLASGRIRVTHCNPSGRQCRTNQWRVHTWWSFQLKVATQHSNAPHCFLNLQEK